MRRVLAVVAWAVLAASVAPGLTLTEHGQSPYVIVEPPGAIPAEKTACRELQEYVRRISGVELPVVPAGHPAAQRILVGQSPEIATLLGLDDFARLGDDEIVIRTVGDTLILSGARPRGSLYAVDAFLEDVLGVRWWTASESRVPSSPDLRSGPLDVRYAPPFMIREAFYADALQHPEFSMHLKSNGNWCAIPPELGGHLRYLGWCHTFAQLLPPGEYFAAHPEWYAEVDGKRTANAQLCLTNVEMRRELVRRAAQWLRDTPDQRLISISQNDNRLGCTCTDCAALTRREGAESGPVIHFVNAVAADLEGEFPDVQVETLAYLHTVKAPQTVRPRRNVIVRLCFMGANVAQPINSDANPAFRTGVEEWSRMAPRLAVWNYTANFSNYLIPHANLSNLGTDLRYFAARHVVAVFEQGDAGSDGVGDLLQLRTWVNSKLMWNPQLDQQALVDEFLSGYYGAAAPHLRRYLDLLEAEGAGKPGTFVGSSAVDTSGWLGLPTLLNALSTMAQAQAAVAGDPVTSARVRRTALSCKFGLLTRPEASRWNHDPQSQALLKDIDLVELMNRSIAEAKEFQVRQGNEGTPFAALEAKLLATVGPALPTVVPGVCRELSPQDWLEIPNELFNANCIGLWSFREQDRHATHQSTVRLPGTFSEWVVQTSLASARGLPSRWRVYLAARCQTPDLAVNAFSCGVYDNGTGTGLGSRVIAAREIHGEDYHECEIGEFMLTPGCILWVQPIRNQDLQIYLDRIILVKVR